MEKIFDVSTIEKLSPQIASLKEIAKRQGIVADFFSFGSAVPSDPESGLYFIAAPDIQALIALKNNAELLEQVIRHNRTKSSAMAACHYNIVNLSNLDGSNVFLLSNECNRAVHEVAIARNSFYEYGLNVPLEIPLPTLDYIHRCDVMRNNHKIPPELRNRYYKLHERTVHDAYVKSKRGQGIFTTILKKFEKQSVDKDFFEKNHIPVINTTVNQYFWEFCKEKLSKHPEFRYYKDKNPYLVLHDNSADPGNGIENIWTDEVEIKQYRIMFPVQQQDIFYNFIHEYNTRNCKGIVDRMELTQSGSLVGYIAVDEMDIDNFDSLCAANKVPYCINKGEHVPVTFANANTYHVGFREKDYPMILAITKRIEEELRNHNYVNSVQVKTANQNRPKYAVPQELTGHER